MEFARVVAARRMVRAFGPDPVDPGVVDRLVDLARRAPSAGNTQALAFVVLEGPAQVARFWDASFPVALRDGFRYPGLFDAPVVVVPAVRPDAYAVRYREPDKAHAGLGTVAAWPVPYWYVDGGMAVMTLLHAAVDEGLGALFFGLFDGEAGVLAALGVPEGWRALGAVALGHPAPDPPGRSAARGRAPLSEVVHRGGW